MVNTLKTLLIAVMDTPSSRHAGSQGLALAASLGARVIGVSVCPAHEGGMSRLHGSDMRKQIEAPHRKVLDEMAGEAEKAGILYRSALLEGQPFEVIADMAEAEEVDLVILGGASRSILERTILGATAERVIGYSRCPVLVIPEGTTVGFSNMLLGTDGSRNSENAEALALQLAKTYGGKLRAVSVVDVPAEYHVHEKGMEAFMDKARKQTADVAARAEGSEVEIATEVMQGDTAKCLVEKALEIKAEMIVIGTHGRTGLRRLMMGSVAANVLRHNRVPALVVP